MFRFAIFHNYRIPKDNLLDKTGSVAADGRYVTPFKDLNKRFGKNNSIQFNFCFYLIYFCLIHLGASLGSLMGGRMGIMSLTATNLSKAVVIAIRYSGVRRQFGLTPDKEEIPVLEYQLQVCYKTKMLK
jgi:acyl-CoA oxidase